MEVRIRDLVAAPPGDAADDRVAGDVQQHRPIELERLAHEAWREVDQAAERLFRAKADQRSLDRTEAPGKIGCGGIGYRLLKWDRGGQVWSGSAKRTPRGGGTYTS